MYIQEHFVQRAGASPKYQQAFPLKDKHGMEALKKTISNGSESVHSKIHFT
jgi:hypothetical protein